MTNAHGEPNSGQSRRRRWPTRFSLFTLLILVTLCAGAIAFAVRRWHECSATAMLRIDVAMPEDNEAEAARQRERLRAVLQNDAFLGHVQQAVIARSNSPPVVPEDRLAEFLRRHLYVQAGNDVETVVIGLSCHSRRPDAVLQTLTTVINELIQFENTRTASNLRKQIEFVRQEQANVERDLDPLIERLAKLEQQDPKPIARIAFARLEVEVKSKLWKGLVERRYTLQTRAGAPATIQLLVPAHLESD